jgi:hypothetical protein
VLDGGYQRGLAADKNNSAANFREGTRIRRIDNWVICNRVICNRVIYNGAGGDDGASAPYQKTGRIKNSQPRIFAKAHESEELIIG